MFIILNLNSQARYDIIIHEIMADPSPQVGLPGHEWIELYNRSNQVINLQSWRLADASGQSAAFPNTIIQPDSFLIICGSSAVTALSNFGRVMGISNFPGLDNEGELIFLKNNQGQSMHAVKYNNSWYGNALKKEGGWSLEMIDPNHPCTGMENWKASTNPMGGSPGRANDINNSNADEESPHLVNAFLFDNAGIQLEFNETLDSTNAARLSNYVIGGGLVLRSIECLGPLFNEVRLTLNDTMATNRLHFLTINNVQDCSQNTLPNTRIPIGKPGSASAGDVIFNEILFNPKPNAHDYVELYNNSNKIIDLAKLFIANKTNGNIGTIKNISSSARYAYPADYALLTEDATLLSLHYLVKDQHALIELSSMPSMPDEDGHLVLLDAQGQVLDELAYKDDWHFKLISDDEGVSLERMDPSAPTQNENNWHSAASSAGYGTPGYVNSQYRQSNNLAAMISVEPPIISPDNDGRDDRAVIRYQLTEPGFVANILLYDVEGRLLRRLVSNSILGSSGYWTWDGLDENGNRLPFGIYILFTEIYNLQGKKARFKNSIVVAKK